MQDGSSSPLSPEEPLGDRGEVCPFCNIHEKVLLKNNLAYVLNDRFPITPGHVLVIPFRHVGDFFRTTAAERNAMLRLAVRAQALLQGMYAPRGYNLGINVGKAAGQTVHHVHLHIVPRYEDEDVNPWREMRRKRRRGSEKA